MNQKEQRLLRKIAELVGELFDAMEKDSKTSEITFDQGICKDLWTHYEEWSTYVDRKHTK